MGVVLLPLIFGGFAVGLLATLFVRSRLGRSQRQQRITSTARGRLQLILLQVGLTLGLWYFCSGIPDTLFGIYAPPHDSSPTTNDFLVALWVWSLQVFLLAVSPGIASVVGLLLLSLFV